MKLTQKIIDDLEKALAHTKKDGTENWKDGDEIEKNKKQFEMVDLVSPAWTIQVPIRKK